MNFKNLLNETPELRSAAKILEQITRRGFDAFIVGGAVRDMVRGVEFDDIDIATNMPVNKLQSIYTSYDVGTGKEHGTIVVRQDGFEFDVAQFRVDGEYSDGRRPDSVELVNDFKLDASRRDFTFNAMGLTKEGDIVDFFGGMEDLEKGVVRAVGSAHARFSEDPVRMLRAIRFAQRMDFDIDEEAKVAMVSLKNEILRVSFERIRKELLKMADNTGAVFAKAVRDMDENGLLCVIFPEFENMKKFFHDPVHHPEDKGGPIFNHVIAAVEANTVADPMVNLAVLFHDIGKGATAEVKENGFNSFHRHAQVGAEMVKEMAKRVKLSNDEVRTLTFAAENHMKFHVMTEMRPTVIRDLRFDENWEVLKAVAFADDVCRGELHTLEEWNKTMDHVEAIKKAWDERPINMVTGTHVMEVTGMKTGKMVGELIRAVSDVMLSESVDDVDALILEKFKELDEQ